MRKNLKSKFIIYHQIQIHPGTTYPECDTRPVWNTSKRISTRVPRDKVYGNRSYAERLTGIRKCAAESYFSN